MLSLNYFRKNVEKMLDSIRNIVEYSDMMKNAIEKLLKEYDQKIIDADKSIERATEMVRNARHNGEDGFFEKKEMYEWQARKMAYCQARADIDSLLDYA